MTHISPVFIFSLPRAGSTLVQRVLGSHPDITTVSEPWILLPYLYTMQETGAYAKYGHHSAVRAIRDFYNQFPNGEDDYLDEIRNLTLRLYAKGVGNQDVRYFLDKTPRYHLVVQEILRLFPNGKFIFLWRNPLAVAASMIQSWGKGQWTLYRYYVDLFDGVENLAAAYQSHRDKVCTVRFEDLLNKQKSEWKRIFDYLQVDFSKNMLESLNAITLKGRYGDKIGEKQYQTITKEPINKWQNIMANPVRRKWCEHYIRWIGQYRLDLMGYDMTQLLDELHSGSSHNLHLAGGDIFRLIYGRFYRVMEPQILWQKSRLE